MRTIWKYPLTSGAPLLDMPGGAKVLTVANQDNVVTMWAEVNPDAVPEQRGFMVVGTGHDLPVLAQGWRLQYVGTAVGLSGIFVLHVYEVVAL